MAITVVHMPSSITLTQAHPVSVWRAVARCRCIVRKCLLHLKGANRNAIRKVYALLIKAECLALAPIPSHK